MKKIALFAVVIALILFSCDSEDVDSDKNINRTDKNYVTVTFHGDPDAILSYPRKDGPPPSGTNHLTGEPPAPLKFQIIPGMPGGVIGKFLLPAEVTMENVSDIYGKLKFIGWGNGPSSYGEDGKLRGGFWESMGDGPPYDDIEIIVEENSGDRDFYARWSVSDEILLGK